MGGSCMHRNEYLLIYIYSSIIHIYLRGNTWYKWGALIRAVIMSQGCTQPFMQKFPSVTNYFSTGLVITLQSECICMPYKKNCVYASLELNGWTHPLSLSFWRIWSTWKTLTSAHTPLAEILLPLRLQKVRQQKESCSSFTINVLLS